MAVNAVAPWEGVLDWVGEPNEGEGKNGKWKSVDFVLKYQDHQMNEKFITFSAFGVDKVDKLLAIPKGTAIKVVWWPDANHVERTGKWYPKNTAISIGLANPEAKSARTDIRVPNFLPQGTQIPGAGSGYKSIPTPQPPLPEYDGPADVDASDLPF